MLGDGVNIRDLAEYLGHDPAITLRVYGHLQQGSHEIARKAMDARMYRPRRVSGGTGAGIASAGTAWPRSSPVPPKILPVRQTAGER
jgi:hypothetical protein